MEVQGYGWCVVCAGVLGRTQGRDGSVCSYGSREEAVAGIAEVEAAVLRSRAVLRKIGDGVLPPLPIGGAACEDSVSPVSPAYYSE